MNVKISINVTKSPRLLLDNYGSLISVEQRNSVPSYFDRLDPETLSLQQYIPINGRIPNIACYEYTN